MSRLFIWITVLFGLIYFGMQGVKSEILRGDALGYYIYLPSVFIYHDLAQPESIPENLDGVDRQIIKDIKNRATNKSTRGYTLNQYTYGVALMEAPFFFIAHGWEKAIGHKANGYSYTYMLLLMISALVYTLLGLVIVYVVLKKYFSPTVSTLATVALFLCTNLFWFTESQAGMSHVPLFFLYALLLLLTIRVHERPGSMLFIAVGFISGLITTIRPTDILCLLIPLLYNVYSRESLRQKSLFIKQNARLLPIVVIAFILPLIPQLLYWKAATGSYFFYSYGDQTFNWTHPKIIEGLFYFANGWLPYSPIMLFALAGMVMYGYIRPWSWCLWVILPVYVYIIYSWYCYNYINGFGSRPMIHLYPLLAIPLAAFIQWLSQQKIAVRTLFAILCLFFFSANISFSMLQQGGMLLSENANMPYAVRLLYRSSMRYSDLVAKDLGTFPPDTSRLQHVYTAIYERYEDSSSTQYVPDPTHAGKYVYLLPGDQEYLQPEPVIYNSKKYKGATWFKCSGRFMYVTPLMTRSRKHGLILSIPGRTDDRGVEIENKVGNWTDTLAKKINVEHYEPGKWGYIYFFTRIPRNIKDGDAIKIFVWNYGRGEIYVDDLRLDAYK